MTYSILSIINRILGAIEVVIDVVSKWYLDTAEHHW